MGASTAVKAALYEAVAGMGFATYTMPLQAADGGAAGAYPYIHIGAVVFSGFDTNTENGFDFTARIYTHWRGRDEQPGLLMQDAIYDRLHHGALDITGWQLILLERQASSTTPAEGSFTGLCEYRALITKEI